MATRVESSKGLSVLTVLLIIFVTMKLTGYVTWSWFWVLSPWLLPLCFVLALLVTVGSIAGFASVLDWLAVRRRFNKAYEEAKTRGKLN